MGCTNPARACTNRSTSPSLSKQSRKLMRRFFNSVLISDNRIVDISAVFEVSTRFEDVSAVGEEGVVSATGGGVGAASRSSPLPSSSLGRVGSSPSLARTSLATRLSLSKQSVKSTRRCCNSFFISDTLILDGSIRSSLSLTWEAVADRRMDEDNFLLFADTTAKITDERRAGLCDTVHAFTTSGMATKENRRTRTPPTTLMVGPKAILCDVFHLILEQF
mmetsp:Transcript_10059/g.12082  ORF Transcript_10059/g.12082 Transcript_10059/m.12082 type:complete len:220 (+) Transcript_10059:285-944(+)